MKVALLLCGIAAVLVLGAILRRRVEPERTYNEYLQALAEIYKDDVNRALGLDREGEAIAFSFGPAGPRA